MLKKRLIFTLLYDSGYFMLSRNFRLQKVGDYCWLMDNYEFSKISFSIDELVVLDVSRDVRDLDRFCDCLATLSESCFLPLAAGGGVVDYQSAKSLLRSGADKVVINSLIVESPEVVAELAAEFGQQCIVASVDVSFQNASSPVIKINSGSTVVSKEATTYLSELSKMPIGELYLNSIDKDGTGQGLDFSLLDLLPDKFSHPVILSGGIGNSSHMFAGLQDSRIDAVSTSHLFNFIGDGFIRSRESLIRNGIMLPIWDSSVLSRLTS